MCMSFRLLKMKKANGCTSMSTVTVLTVLTRKNFIIATGDFFPGFDFFPGDFFPMSYQSHMRAVVSGLVLYMWTLYLA